MPFRRGTARFPSRMPVPKRRTGRPRDLHWISRLRLARPEHPEEPGARDQNLTAKSVPWCTYTQVTTGHLPTVIFAALQNFDLAGLERRGFDVNSPGQFADLTRGLDRYRYELLTLMGGDVQCTRKPFDRRRDRNSNNPAGCRVATKRQACVTAPRRCTE